MRRVLYAFFLSLFTSFSFAIDAHVKPAPDGSDANDCLTWGTACLTLQRAADVAGGGVAKIYGDGNVFLSHGTWTTGAAVEYYKRITFHGDCENTWAVAVSTPNAIAFNVQDHAIVTVRCMTIAGEGGTGLSGRQFAIIDYQQLRFGSMSVHVSVNEMSKANCGNSVEIVGSAVYHIKANGMSSISAGCPTSLATGVTILSFAHAVWMSFIDTHSASFTGTNAGMKYINDSSLIVGGNAMPGSGFVCQNGCLIQ